jgi:hypothetical protein
LCPAQPRQSNPSCQTTLPLSKRWSLAYATRLCRTLAYTTLVR